MDMYLCPLLMGKVNMFTCCLLQEIEKMGVVVWVYRGMVGSIFYFHPDGIDGRFVPIV